MNSFITIITCFFCFSFLPNASAMNHPITDPSPSKSSKLKPIVFVPGSFHGAWCWYKMQALLNQNGNPSEAIDLPGHGLDNTLPGKISLEDYVETVGKVLEKYKEPVILIGHSRAGIVISQVAERWPEKIDQLVYLCAFLIPNGEPMVATALTDTHSVLVSSLIFDHEAGWHLPKKESYREAFYHDCSEADLALCSALLTKEPNAPVGTPLQLTSERFGKVKKNYIFTTEDRAITYHLQKKMVQRVPVDRTFTLKASHSPFLSQPDKLVEIIKQL
ncbi:MAG: alpha/beta fold hydrolase [Saprospiraceae bacterium]|nr:alpha/beta fold hydrolase [Saprospiraceae bacterium]